MCEFSPDSVLVFSGAIRFALPQRSVLRCPRAQQAPAAAGQAALGWAVRRPTTRPTARRTAPRAGPAARSPARQRAAQAHHHQAGQSPAGTRPAAPAADRSCTEAWNGQASGSVTAPRSPRPAARPAACRPGRRRHPGSPLPCEICCSTVQFTAAASGTPSATNTPAAIAPAAAARGRTSSRCRRGHQDRDPRCATRRLPSRTRENSAVISGPSAMVTSTLATLVRVSATMKAVNMPAQHSAETQTSRGARNNWPTAPGPASRQQRMHQRQRIESAAPERDFEAARAVQMPRDHARRCSTAG
jgi:hypothetical protein